jgi:curli production assembly/transport component CsgG
MFSTAVSQGADTMLIDALKTAGNGKWFRVVERVGIDHLTRERQIVRTTREQYDEEDDTGLAPLLFAGMILEGGIIGFDTNIETGGRGARYLGIGMSQAYRRDIVTVHLRAVSTLTGEILLNVQTSKTILSIADGFDVFKFIDMDTQLIEIEDGMTENESVTRSLRSCIEAAVLELIYQGEENEFWKINWPEKEIEIETPVANIEEIRG